MIRKGEVSVLSSVFPHFDGEEKKDGAKGRDSTLIVGASLRVGTAPSHGGSAAQGPRQHGEGPFSPHIPYLLGRLKLRVKNKGGEKKAGTAKKWDPRPRKQPAQLASHSRAMPYPGAASEPL